MVQPLAFLFFLVFFKEVTSVKKKKKTLPRGQGCSSAAWGEFRFSKCAQLHGLFGGKTFNSFIADGGNTGCIQMFAGARVQFGVLSQSPRSGFSLWTVSGSLHP